MKTIAILAGDGIGPEITAQAVAVLKALEPAGVKLALQEAAVGGAAYDAAGDPLPDATFALARESDAILFGSVGGPQYDALP
jgi:3-isopropylmalate dehydrogenase